MPVAIGVAVTILSGQLVRAGRFPSPAAGVLFSVVLDGLVLALLVPVLALQRWAWVALPLPAAILAIGTSMLAAAGFVVLATVGIATFTWGFNAPYAADRLVQAAYYLILLLGWSVTAAWLRARRRSLDLLILTHKAEQEAMAADMGRLRMQLDAHFLFNALNTIAVEIQDSPRQALLLVRELSHYLRFSFETADLKQVPVAAEVAALRSFLQVQMLRFGSQLTFRVDQSEATYGRMIPPFLLQPLVENATKHGIPNADGILNVEIIIRLVEDELRVLVTNPGDLRPSSERSGTGLVALSRRLHLHYPGRHHFALLQRGDMVRAELHLTGIAC